jgi:hypothetical protein
LNHRRKDRAACNRAEPTGNEPLERPPKRVARNPFQTFGEMVNAEQKKTQSTQELYDGGGIHGLCKIQSFTSQPASGECIARTEKPSCDL